MSKCSARMDRPAGDWCCHPDAAQFKTVVTDSVCAACPLFVKGSFDKVAALKNGVAPKPQSQHSTMPGAGTELKHLLSSWGVEVVSGCRCLERAAEMDRNGTQWCRDNIDTIAAWLDEEARNRHWIVRAIAKFGSKYVITQAIERAEAKTQAA